jgi:hypothetical protein
MNDVFKTDRSRAMRRAWQLWREHKTTYPAFGEALGRAWLEEKWKLTRGKKEYEWKREQADLLFRLSLWAKK